MQCQRISGLTEWIEFLNLVDIPVLKHTVRGLLALRKDDENLSAWAIAHVIKHDPLMTIKVLRYLQQNKNTSQNHEVIEVEQALMMIGLENSLKKIPADPVVEDVLSKESMDALVYLLRVVHRSNLASTYASNWAVRLQDLHFEEIRIAALLHDFTELLMWCFAPAGMLKIRSMQQQDNTLRSNIAQEQIFGFSLNQLQSELVKLWSLPTLLITLMDDQYAAQARVRNVSLAVNLARHSSNGWNDAALPDDYKDIGKLLHMETKDVIAMIGRANNKMESRKKIYV
ncbi:MAG: HDOD domain-containing protein [Nitrosomonas sp.]|nr:HDOD domain-containing protein [Nitrosomonas sp.]